jgi:hypothetical protein
MEEKLHHYLSECGNKPADHRMRFEVLMAMNTEIKIIWDMIPCGLVQRNLLPPSSSQVKAKCWYLQF